MSASTEEPQGEEYRRGWNAALAAVRSILEAGEKYDVLPTAAAMIEVGLLDPVIAAQVLRRAAPPERLKETGGADVQH